jgi:hypothetical protein
MFQRIARASAGPNSDMRCVLASLFSSEPSMHLQLLAVDKSMEQKTQFKLLRYGRDEEFAGSSLGVLYDSRIA